MPESSSQSGNMFKVAIIIVLVLVLLFFVFTPSEWMRSDIVYDPAAKVYVHSGISGGIAGAEALRNPIMADGSTGYYFHSESPVPTPYLEQPRGRELMYGSRGHTKLGKEKKWGSVRLSKKDETFNPDFRTSILDRNSDYIKDKKGMTLEDYVLEDSIHEGQVVQLPF